MRLVASAQNIGRLGAARCPVEDALADEVDEEMHGLRHFQSCELKRYYSKHKLTPHLTCIYSTLWFPTHSESTPEIYIINSIQPFQKPYPPTNCFELFIFENNLNQSNLVLF